MPNRGSLTNILDLTTNIGGEGGGGVRYISDTTLAPEPQVEPSLPRFTPCTTRNHVFKMRRERA
jgi:hypothetical protein